MDPAPLPPPTPSALRRRLPLLVSGLVIVVLAGALIVSFSGGGSTDDAEVIRLDPGAQQPPDLVSGQDLAGTRLPRLTYTTFDGDTRELATNGRPMLINMWSSTCAPCVAEMPALEKVWLANRDSIDIIGLDHIEPPELGRAMAERTGVTYPLGRDTKGIILRELGGVGLPYTVLVASDGTILATHAGALTEAQFTALVKTATGN